MHRSSLGTRRNMIGCALVLTFAISPLRSQTDLTRSRVLGIAHVAFRVSDTGKTCEFYEKSLGFAELSSLPRENGKDEIALVKVNDEQYVELLQGDSRSKGQVDHFALYTNDLAGLRQQLLAKRVPIERDIHTGRVGNSFLTIRDPDGHPLEIVEYSPTSLTGQSKGKLMPEDRISNHISHVGIVVRSEQSAMRFYRDILGFREIARSGGESGRAARIDLQVPDGSDVVELIPFTGVPSATDLKAENYLGLTSSDVRKSLALLQRRPGFQFSHLTPAPAGDGLPPRIDLLDSDGARIEIMELVKRESAAASPKP